MSNGKCCRICGITKPIEEFYRAEGCIDGRRGECRDCFRGLRHEREQHDPSRLDGNRERVRRWRIENDEYYREAKRRYQKTDAYKRSLRRTHLKAKYGITPEDYERRLEAQGGGCAICGRPPGDTALHVDHCHETGRVRGLLCFSCNAGLGQFRHDPELLGAARTYAAVHWRVEDLKAAGRAPRGERS
jgi:hypothetical protein